MNQSINFGESLCRQCGLCCNGVIFADVRSPGGEAVTALKKLGAKPKAAGVCDGRKIFSLGQPCAAFQNMQCQVYAQRPDHCRKFDCLLLKKVNTGKRSLGGASKIVRRARALNDRIREFLCLLGNREEHLPLAARFAHVAQAMENGGDDLAQNKIYAVLTTRYHELTHLLSAEFYNRES